jgi:hypothetical protein
MFYGTPEQVLRLVTPQQGCESQDQFYPVLFLDLGNDQKLGIFFLEI